MKPQKYPRRAHLDDRIELAITSDLKERAYVVAAKKGLPAAEFIRQAIAVSVAMAAA